jgi:signal transduction histidine kinase
MLDFYRIRAMMKQIGSLKRLKQYHHMQTTARFFFFSCATGFVNIISDASASEENLQNLPILLTTPTLQQENIPQILHVEPVLSFLKAHQLLLFVAVCGLAVFSATVVWFYRREAKRWQVREHSLLNEAQTAQMRAQICDAVLALDQHVVAVWHTRNHDPVIEGDTKLLVPFSASLLAFHQWMDLNSAQTLETALLNLKEKGTAFNHTIRATDGKFIEISGRVFALSIVVRFCEVSGAKSELLSLKSNVDYLCMDRDRLQTILQTLPAPVWMRDEAGRINWVNKAYLAFVQAEALRNVLVQDLDLLPLEDRQLVRTILQTENHFHRRISTKIAHQNRILDFHEYCLRGTWGQSTWGYAADLSEVAEISSSLEQKMAAQITALSSLSTATAMFDADQKLTFCNPAYRRIWNITPQDLQRYPTDGALLDFLREQRLLQEQADYRKWKQELFSAYHSKQASQQDWYLPDGRTLRVQIIPNQGGGVTYLYEDVTQQIHLESRYNALIRVQSETLETLNEGVIVFGADGRVKLHNPAFTQLWHLPEDVLQTGGQKPHVDDIARACRAMAPEDQAWLRMKALVVGLYDRRQGAQYRIHLLDGRVLESAIAPLPDGATLITFADITASVNVELALTERNEALERAGQIRDSFVHHVSYELRSPLTSIIGFSELLAAGAAGDLSDKQREYISHITQSSDSLLVIIDDILDLASIDHKTMSLDIASVNVVETLAAVGRGVGDRLKKQNMSLKAFVAQNAATFSADPKRVRQVLYNLLSNAINFSKEGGEIIVKSEIVHKTNTATAQTSHYLALSVIDRGRGIPNELLQKVFNRFESHITGGQQRGVGLGLSIVKSFVELHGGCVELKSIADEGTTITCFFPIEARVAQKPTEQIVGSETAIAS